MSTRTRHLRRQLPFFLSPRAQSSTRANVEGEAETRAIADRDRFPFGGRRSRRRRAPESSNLLFYPSSRGWGWEERSSRCLWRWEGRARAERVFVVVVVAGLFFFGFTYAPTTYLAFVASFSLSSVLFFSSSRERGFFVRFADADVPRGGGGHVLRFYAKNEENPVSEGEVGSCCT